MHRLIGFNVLSGFIFLLVTTFSATAVAQVDVLAPEITQIKFASSGGSDGKTRVTAVVKDDDKVESVLLSLYANEFRECRNAPDNKLTLEMLADGSGSLYQVSYTDAQIDKLHGKSPAALPRDTCFSIEAKDSASNLSTRFLNNPPVLNRPLLATADAKPKGKLMYIVAGVAAVALLAVLSQSDGAGDGGDGNVLLITAPAP